MPADGTGAASASDADLQRRVDELTAALRARDADYEAAVLREAAVAEVLQVINSSPGDVGPVFEAILSKAMRLCDAAFGTLATYDGQRLHTAATRGVPEAFARYRFSNPPSYGPGTGPGRLIAGEDCVHDMDARDSDAYRQGEPSRRAIVDLGGARTILNVALRKNDALLGTISLYRQEVRPFSDQQITLLRSFAAQAVIAIGNARLLSETREALEQQTATAEILTVISQSPTDVGPVLAALAKAATKFCGAIDAQIGLREGDGWVVVAHEGPVGVLEGRRSLTRHTAPGRAMIDGKIVQIVDLQGVEGDEFPEARELGVRLGFRSALAAPLLRDHVPIGAIALRRREPGEFSPRRIELLKTFAAQAVIAIENVRLFTELSESLKRQTATAEILRIINASPGVLEPVFDAILAKAHDLCGAAQGSLQLYDGEQFRAVATRGMDTALAAFLRGGFRPYGAPVTWQARSMQFADAAEMARRHPNDAVWRAAVELGRVGTMLSVPLVKDGTFLGRITAARQEVRLFSDKEIALLEGFAAQAVIAMENARLLGELRESLDQQTATSDVLRTISRAAVDLEAVLETLVETVARLCRADQAYMFRRQEELHHLVASHGISDATKAYMLANPFAPDRGTTSGRVLLERRTVHISDVLVDAEYTYSEGQKIAGYRTVLGIPLMRDQAMIGVFVVSRTRVEPFSDKEIALATGFADQAVIAIENARLFEELRDRQAELRVTFDNMGDGVAMFDAKPRLAAWNRNFQEIIGLPEARLAERPLYADYLRLLAERGEFGTDNMEAELASRLADTDRELRLERTRPDGTVIEVRRNAVPGGGFVLIYSDVTERRRAEAEIRAARDAAETALERQTATADILKVIASSPTNVQPVLDAVVAAAVRFCRATDATISLRDRDEMVRMAHHGTLPTSLKARRPLARDSASARAIFDGRTVHHPDIQSLDAAEFATGRRLAKEYGYRAALAAPMLREGVAIGNIVLRKIEPGPFTSEQVELLETFAAQAAIAIENVRLFTELRDSLERLKAAQANLIQAEKMASLGQLTAGIAHEIKNPLNFVNNFASLSVELLDELKEVAEPALATLDEDKRAELEETMELLVGNLGKITEHGKRADGIVRSMLSHSRGGSGDWQPSDINALVEEALNLAYHGARAQDQEFNVTLERDFDKTEKPIDVVPQDVTRVFLNLFGNGFYATNKRRTTGRESGFRPTVKVTTRDLGELVEVRVRDNGTGIPRDIREKLFQPFFTTKPTGEGTGLGLSISYDIVTQQHGGSIAVESEPGSFTEFTVRLPRTRRATTAENA